MAESRIMIEYDGKLQSISELASNHNLPADVLRTRLYHGWELDKALKTPHRARHEWRLEWDELVRTSKSATVLARQLGVSVSTINKKRKLFGVTSSYGKIKDKLSKVTDKEFLTLDIDVISDKHDIPACALYREIRKRKIVSTRNNLVRINLQSLYTKAAVAGMLLISDNIGSKGVKQRIAETLGVSRERGRQLFNEIISVLKERIKGYENEEQDG